MNTIEKALTGAATSARAEAETAACGGASLPTMNYTTVLRGCQVASLLGVGEENGIKLTELVQMTGRNERVVRRMIQHERKDGALILADNANGYFLPGSISELQRFCQSMRHRCSEIATVTRIAERALAEAEGQTMMEGF